MNSSANPGWIRLFWDFSSQKRGNDSDMWMVGKWPTDPQKIEKNG
jgi:hypothetical protein